MDRPFTARYSTVPAPVSSQFHADDGTADQPDLHAMPGKSTFRKRRQPGPRISTLLTGSAMLALLLGTGIDPGK